MQVADFVSYLSAHCMVDTTKIQEYCDEGYNNRMRIHNYAYLARSFGWNMSCVFRGHLNGVFSPEISVYLDYMETANAKRVTALPGMNEEEFLSAVKGKSTDWLEAAASIMHTTSNRPEFTPDDLHFVINFEAGFIDSVYRDLEALGLMPIPQVY